MVNEYTKLQEEIRNRRYRVGWHPLDCHSDKQYSTTIYETWHGAAIVVSGLAQSDPSMVFFVEAVNAKTHTSRPTSGG